MSRNKHPITFSPTIFNCFKPAGPSSFEVVSKFKRNLPKGIGKIGHFGTLDPFACGVLLVGIAGATKLTDLVSTLPKTYIAVGKLGIKSDSGDVLGNIVKNIEISNEIRSMSKDHIDKRVKDKFFGVYMQPPHHFSASKHNGIPLYSYARSGEFIDKQPVERNIYDISVIKYYPPYLSIFVTVSSGTYIRSLFEDIANELGTVGMLISLVRSRIGDFSIESSIRKKNWPMMDRPFDENQFGMSLEKAFPFEEISLTVDDMQKFATGVPLSFAKNFSGRKWIKGPQRKIVGLVGGASKDESVIRFQNEIDQELSQIV